MKFKRGDLLKGKVEEFLKKIEDEDNIVFFVQKVKGSGEETEINFGVLRSIVNREIQIVESMLHEMEESIANIRKEYTDSKADIKDIH